ncbi:MAG: 6,7-dimethyl-8-ribityllumazine synthase [Acidimicrobiia bacterium]|nr:6,7-dimethyl-8-ribityllumazine synthase [Acidimicrobiia bacterium]
MKPVRVAVVTAEFNGDVTAALRDGALAALRDAGVKEVVDVAVAGALELPVLARVLAATCDAVIAIGAVIEGETDHYVHVCTQTSAGLMQVSVETGVPIGNAVLTVRTYEHARERSLPGPGNKGAEAVQAALQAVAAIRSLSD